MVTQPRRPVTVGPARTNAHRRSVAVVSNNSALAVRAYLARHGLDDRISLVVARTNHDPALLNPALREHYARTLAARAPTWTRTGTGAVAEVGQGTARVWRLYMAGSRLGFDRNHIELHQVLGVKLQPDGTSDMPLRPDREIPRVLAS
jgi:cyclopropane fatty-acyl-phospholipid synthase-like methyltransferase